MTNFQLIPLSNLGAARSEQANERRRVCRICLSEGINNSQVIERVIKPPSHPNHFARMICATCWQQERETPATCKTFALYPETARSQNGEQFSGEGTASGESSSSLTFAEVLYQADYSVPSGGLKNASSSA
jgi:hypothetical protein